MEKTVDTTAKIGKNKSKKKKSPNRIQNQMEFYFSDSNLRRDRFLREKIFQAVPRPTSNKDDSSKIGVELKIFLNFNQIRALTSSESEIRENLSTSQSLETFQADNDDWYIARKDWAGKVELTEFLHGLDSNNQEFDKRTVYCENLPIHANQEWLRKIFTQFGKINLISVPTFKGHQRIKQFCFVEFGNEEGLKNMMDYFKQFNGVLCYDDTESNNLQSIQKFHEEEQEMNKMKEEEVPEEAQKVPVNDSKDDKMEKNKEAETVTISPKKKRNRRKNKNSKSKDKGEAEEEKEENPPAEEKKEIPKKNYPELNDNMIYDLKIMPKVEWKRLRNKYLNLQREMVRELKKQAYFRKINQNIEPRRQPIASNAVSCDEPPPNKKLKFDDNEEEDSHETPPVDGESVHKSKRRKRGREKIKEKLKKGSHIFFDAE